MKGLQNASKIHKCRKAAELIKDGSTVAIDGFIGFCLADDILGNIEERFIRDGHPRDLSVVNVAALGGDGRDRGINRFAHRGLMRRFLCSNLSLAPKLYPLIMDNTFPTFMMPTGGAFPYDEGHRLTQTRRHNKGGNKDLRRSTYRRWQSI